jgi:hypothetical protein
MSKPKYLYIDDESGPSEKSALNVFNDLGVIEVELFKLSDYREFGKIRNELIDRRKNKAFDGIIIDLRLDGDGEDRVDFNATSIAQELRSITARGDISAFPIVLCSTEPKIRETYDADKSSHDLFDYKFEKSINPDSKRFSRKLFSLVKGYDWLNSETLSPEKIFKGADTNILDTRILERFDETNKLVVYDYAHFVVKNLFHHTNPLLKDKIVAARLGIDKEASAESWFKLMDEVFAPAKYSGLFADGWDRWWADSIVNMFKDLTGKRLSFLKAEERVKLLTDKTGITGLIAATPIKHCQSTEFWTICEAYKKPLDPLEGFKIFASSELKPWQESKYLSFDAIVERIGVEKGLRHHPSEKERIEFVKQSIQSK